MKTRRPPLSALLLSAALAVPAPALAQSALLRDIHPGTQAVPGGAQDATASGSTVFFRAFTDLTGSELWRTDGSPAGTSRVVDLVPGPGSSYPEQLTDVGGTLFFVAATNIDKGASLWKTDGTAQGTVRLLRPPSLSTSEEFNLGELTRVGASLFFAASHDGAGQELWKSDGTPAGTVRVKDLTPGPQGSELSHFTELGGTLYFFLGAGAGQALWKSDGTEAGTVPVRTLPAGSVTVALQALGGTLFSLERSEEGGFSLWTSDGTASGSVKVADLPASGFNPWTLTASGNRVFLSDTQALWTSDGTASGTRLLKTFAFTWGRPVAVDGGRAVLLAHEPGGALQLWASDGTEAGTMRLLDRDFSTPPDSLASTGPAAFFVHIDPSTYRSALWTTDGTPAGTREVKDLLPAGTPLGYSFPASAAGGQLFVTALRPGSPPSSHLWRSDGTAEGTLRLLAPQQEPLGSQPGAWTQGGPVAFFAATDDTHGRELWKTDGTPAGTVLVKDLAPGTADGLPPFFPEFLVRRADGTLFLFTLVPGPAGTVIGSLWKSDGTEAGTVRLKQFAPGSLDVEPRLRLVGDTLYFAASDEAHGLELWRSDGTEAGTVLVHDLRTGPEGSAPAGLEVVGGTLYFSANDGQAGRELWKSDGTAAGTVRVKDLRPGPEDALNAYDTQLVGVGSTLYFVADDGVHGFEPWKSDGTEAGTVLLKDVRAGEQSSRTFFDPAGSTLYFLADDGVHGFEPWKSDGTGAGTVLLKDIVPGAGSGLGLGFSATAGGVLFLAATPEHGLEPWVTDGTEAGTRLLKDVWPGPDSGIRDLSTALALEDRGLALFAATDGTSGEEPWVTDGTPEGTERVADVAPGAASSAPRGLTRVGERFGFLAVDPTAGFEPHALPLPVRRDRLAPTLTCPAAVSATASEASGAAVTYTPAMASDNAGAPMLEYSHASGSTFPVGTTPVKVTATDAAGNRTECTFEVTVTRQDPGPAPQEEAEGCACTASGPGAGALWSLLALLAGVSVRRRRA